MFIAISELMDAQTVFNQSSSHLLSWHFLVVPFDDKLLSE